jgi:hypothetical protein
MLQPTPVSPTCTPLSSYWSANLARHDVLPARWFSAVRLLYRTQKLSISEPLGAVGSFICDKLLFCGIVSTHLTDSLTARNKVIL